MTPRTYLLRLLARIRALQGQTSTPRMHRLHLASLASLSSSSVTALLGNSPPALVVNCTGIGSLTLGGVKDHLVHPIRGHVVKVRAPWVREGFTRQIGALGGAEGGQRTYVIPRPDGEVILGGTREVGDWDPYPSPASRRDILQRAVEICPALIPAHKLAQALPVPEVPPKALDALSGKPATVRRIADRAGEVHGPIHPLDEYVTGEVVGFRPQRHGGIRLERGDKAKMEDGHIIEVIHNYGHGGAGWQSCWGCAEDAVGLVQEALGPLGRPVRAKL